MNTPAPDPSAEVISPCAFCASPPNYHTTGGVWWSSHHVFYCPTVQCPANRNGVRGEPNASCGSGYSYRTREEALAAWNKRAPAVAVGGDDGILWMQDESGQLDPRAALAYARQMRDYLAAYIGYDFKQADPDAHIEHRLGVALDNLEECASMLMNLASRHLAPPAGGFVVVPDTDKVSAALNYAVQAIYLDDSADFLAGLWGVVNVLAPELVAELENDPASAYEKTEPGNYFTTAQPSAKDGVR